MRDLKQFLEIFGIHIMDGKDQAFVLRRKEKGKYFYIHEVFRKEVWEDEEINSTIKIFYRNDKTNIESFKKEHDLHKKFHPVSIEKAIGKSGRIGEVNGKKILREDLLPEDMFAIINIEFDGTLRFMHFREKQGDYISKKAIIGACGFFKKNAVELVSEMDEDDRSRTTIQTFDVAQDLVNGSRENLFAHMGWFYLQKADNETKFLKVYEKMGNQSSFVAVDKEDAYAYPFFKATIIMNSVSGYVPLAAKPDQESGKQNDD